MKEWRDHEGIFVVDFLGKWRLLFFGKGGEVHEMACRDQYRAILAAHSHEGC